MKSILIFGATGNIGRYLTDYLFNSFKQSEYEIIAIGRRSTDFFKRYGIKYIQLSVDQKNAYDMLPQKDVFAAIHLANLLPAQMQDNNAAAYIQVNTLGTAYMLDYLHRVKADRILFTQTYADLAGHWGQSVCLSNSLPRKLVYTGDHAVYTISKCAAVDLMEYYFHEFGLKNFIFRLPNIYLYSPEKFYFVNGVKKVVSYRYMIQKALNGEPIEMWGDPNRGRDMVYVKDLCQMMYLALQTTTVSHGTYNVGTGKMTTLQQQIEGMIDVFSPSDHRSVIIPRPEMYDAMQYVMDISDAQNDLGYKPQYDYLAYLEDYKKEMLSNRLFSGESITIK